MTVSHWRRSIAPGHALGCDVCVVGAGIAGVSAALHLERLGLSTIVLERDRAASGASGKNAGFLMRGAADNYAVACRDWGRDTARLVWRWTEENLAALRDLGIESIPTVQRIPSCLLGLEPEEAAELRDAAQLLAEDGFAVDLIDRGDDLAWRPRSPRARGPLIGLVNPNDAACNPVHLLEFLSLLLSRPILERQEVVDVSVGPGERVSLRTAEHTVECRRALICTNAYASLLLPELAPLVRPTRGQMLALRFPAHPRLDMSYYANRGYEYFRQTADGAIVLGGCRRRHADSETGFEDRTTPDVQRDLEAFARDHLGDQFEITARWSGAMGYTADALPLIGPVPAPWNHAGLVWFAGGCTGHGMSLFHRVAQAAVDAMIRGADNPFPLERAVHPARNGLSGAAPLTRA